jgi:hypothetical protein
LQVVFVYYFSLLALAVQSGSRHLVGHGKPDGHFFRVRAAFRAPPTRPALPFVRAAFLAAALRELVPRRRAAPCACRASALLEAPLRPSRRKAERTARDRLVDGFLPGRLCFRACCALRLVLSEVCPFSGAGNFTPARRAFERPMAIACFADRAPCLPSRTWCISSRTNSPAWVDADFPAFLSRRALSIVCFSGMFSSVIVTLQVQPRSSIAPERNVACA